ncbi:MAG: M56 family metallopeptidase [Bacteroidales bacterium]|nr:M56 family metallopeptidase [Bacteroidales bacterium]
MGAFVVYILKCALCLALFYLFYKLLLTRDTFHRLNRMTLLVCMGLSCLIPFVHYSVQAPTLVSQSVLELEDYITFTVEPVAETVDTPFNWMILFVGIYLLGVVGFLCYHIWSLSKLVFMLHNCKVQLEEEGYRVQTHNFDISPFSWMHTIIISEKDLKEQGDILLEHEKAHIRLRHSYDLLLATFCTVFQWFNPAAWLLKQELQNIHEYEADDSVLQRGIDAKTYQILLVKKAAGARLYSLANSFNHSSLKKRITMMLQKRSSAWACAKYIFVLPITAMAVAAFARPEVTSLAKAIETDVEAVSPSILPQPEMPDVKGEVTVKDEAVKSLVPKRVASSPVQPQPEEVAVVETSSNPVEEDDVVYQVVDKQPTFMGGNQALMKYLASNVKYPEQALKEGLSGRVIVQFVVDKDGSIKDPRVARSASPLLDAAAIEAVKNMPNWTPAMQMGKPVKVRFTLPIAFLNDEDLTVNGGEKLN